MKELRTQGDLAGIAAPFRRIGDWGVLGLFANSFVICVELRGHLIRDGAALCTNSGELFLILGRALTGTLGFGLDISLLYFQRRLSSFEILFERLGLLHQVEDFVFGSADLAFGVGDLVLKSTVLLVGSRLQHLVFELRGLLLLDLDVAFQLLALALVGS